MGFIKIIITHASRRSPLIELEFELKNQKIKKKTTKVKKKLLIIHLQT